MSESYTRARTCLPAPPSHRAWLEDLINGEAGYATSDIVLSGFVRVVTHPRVFPPPSPTEHALGFVEAFRGRPNAAPVAPGPCHWGIFAKLCRTGFARFPGLRWRLPFEPEGRNRPSG
jgi:uncharacterized protein